MRVLESLLALAYGAPRREPAGGTPRKILLIRRNGIGDMICALPLVPFAYLRSGARVSDLSVDAVVAKLDEWIPGIGRGDWI